MTWLTWRQFRVPLLAVFTGLAAICVVLAITGPELVGRTDFSDTDVLYGGSVLVLYLVPALIGVFWGVPLITRELETGTHNLIWNQSVTRKRWLTVKLGAGMLAAMVAGALLSVAVSWWASPIDAMASRTPDRSMLNRMAPVIFGARGIVPIGYAAFAFVLGIAVGMVLRRTVTAMAVTLVLFAAVQLLVPSFVRPYLMPATDETVAITSDNITQITGSNTGVAESLKVKEPLGSWVLVNETLASDGATVFPLPDMVQNCLPRPGQPPQPEGRTQGHESAMKCFEVLSANGYKQHVSYQPAIHFWPLQWIETALFLGLSAMVTWFCFRRLRHLS